MFLCCLLVASFGEVQAENEEEVTLMRVGVMLEPPFVIQEVDGTYTGLSIDLWKSIAEEQEVGFVFVSYNDHLGLIRALDFGDIDISINPIHVNEVRLKMLDVTQPFFVSRVGVATVQNDLDQITVFVRNFFSIEFLEIILLLIFVIFVFGTLLWMAERKENTVQFRPGWIGLFDGLWWSAVTMTTVGYGDKAPKTRMGRVIAMVWMFTAIIIISGFTASIASALTVSSLSRTIQSSEDLRDTEKIGTVYSSSSEDFLRFNQIPTTGLYGNPTQALKALAAKEVELLLYDKSVLNYLIGQLQLGHKVTLLPVQFNKQYRSFFLSKNSPHTAWVNPMLVRKINQPLWEDLLKRYNLEVE